MYIPLLRVSDMEFLNARTFGRGVETDEEYVGS